MNTGGNVLIASLLITGILCDTGSPPVSDKARVMCNVVRGWLQSLAAVWRDMTEYDQLTIVQRYIPARLASQRALNSE